MKDVLTLIILNDILHAWGRTALAISASICMFSYATAEKFSWYIWPERWQLMLSNMVLSATREQKHSFHRLKHINSHIIRRFGRRPFDVSREGPISLLMFKRVGKFNQTWITSANWINAQIFIMPDHCLTSGDKWPIEWRQTKGCLYTSSWLANGECGGG